MLALAAAYWLDLPSSGKRVVLIAADPEYRSEQAMPQLGRILAANGFSVVVLFAQRPAGVIDPTYTGLVPGLHHLAKADLCVLMTRFQEWPDRDMAHFARYVESGRPLIALRTSTHAFNYPADSASPYREWSWNQPDGGFGRRVLGETWRSHWGRHGVQGTRARPQGDHPTVRGVGEIFVTTDLYEARPTPKAEVLLTGEITTSLEPTSPLLNDPKRGPMPVAWRMPGSQRVITTTMGSSLDLLDANFRRFLLQSAFWATETPVRKLRLDLVGEYKPTMWGFDKHTPGVRIEDLLRG